MIPKAIAGDGSVPPKSHVTRPTAFWKMSTTPRLLRRPDVEALTGLSKSTIYARIAKGDFPAPLKLGYRTALWPEKAVVDWINQKISGNYKNHG